MSDSKIKFNKVKNKVVLACLIIQEWNEPVRGAPSGAYFGEFRVHHAPGHSDERFLY